MSKKSENQVDPVGFQKRKEQATKENLAKVQVKKRITKRMTPAMLGGPGAMSGKGPNASIGGPSFSADARISKEQQDRQTIMRASGEITNAMTAQCLIIRGSEDFRMIAENDYLKNDPTLAEKRKEFLESGGNENVEAKQQWTDTKKKLMASGVKGMFGSTMTRRFSSAEQPSKATLAMIRCIEKVRLQIKNLKIRDELIANLVSWLTSEFQGERCRGDAVANEWWSEMGIAEHVEPVIREKDRVMDRLRSFEKAKLFPAKTAKVETIFPGVGWVKRPEEALEDYEEMLAARLGRRGRRGKKGGAGGSSPGGSTDGDHSSVGSPGGGAGDHDSRPSSAPAVGRAAAFRKNLKRSGTMTSVSRKLTQLFDDNQVKDGRKKSGESHDPSLRTIDSEYYRRKTLHLGTTLERMRATRWSSSLSDSMGFEKKNFDARNLLKEKEQYNLQDDMEIPPKRSIMDPQTAMRERNITHRPLTAAMVRNAARSDFGYGIRPIIGMRGVAAPTLSGMVTVAYEPYSMAGDGFLAAELDNAEKLREKLQNDRRKRAQERALKSYRKNLMRKAKRKMAFAQEDEKMRQKAAAEEAARLAELEGGAKLKKAFSMRIGFGSLSSDEEDEDSDGKNAEEIRKQKVKDMLHEGNLRASPMTKPDHDDPHSLFFVALSNLADRKGREVMLQICKMFDRGREQRARMKQRILEDQLAGDLRVAEKKAIEEREQKGEFLSNLQMTADVFSRPLEAIPTMVTKEAKYAKACEAVGILPKGPDVEYDGFAFLQDKQLMAAEFADNDAEFTGKWKNLRIGGSVHWHSVYNLLSSRPWSNLRKLEIWGNLGGDRAFGVMALQALFQSTGKQLTVYETKEYSKYRIPGGEDGHFREGAPDLRNMIRAHKGDGDCALGHEGATTGAGLGGGRGGNKSLGVEYNTLHASNVADFPNESEKQLHLSGLVNMPRNSGAGTGGASQSFAGPKIDLPAVAGDPRPVVKPRALDMLNAKRSSDLILEKEKREGRSLPLAFQMDANTAGSGMSTPASGARAGARGSMSSPPGSPTSGGGAGAMLHNSNIQLSADRGSGEGPRVNRDVRETGISPTVHVPTATENAVGNMNFYEIQAQASHGNFLYYPEQSSPDMNKGATNSKGLSPAGAATATARQMSFGTFQRGLKERLGSQQSGIFYSSMGSIEDFDDEDFDTVLERQREIHEREILSAEYQKQHGGSSDPYAKPKPDRATELHPASGSLSPAKLQLKKLTTAALDLPRGSMPFPVHLLSLSLRGTKLFAVPHASFFAGVEKLPLLTELDLADTCLGYLKHANDGAGVTTVVRDSLSKLQKLNLSHNLLHEGLFELGDALRKNEFVSLTELCLSHITAIDIDNCGLPFVLECLRENDQIRILDISHCMCTAKTMFVLEQTLLSAKSAIVEVDCRFNPIGVEGIQAMNRALCYAEPYVFGNENMNAPDIAINYTNLRTSAPTMMMEGVNDRSLFQQSFDTLRNIGVTCVSESPNYNNSDPSRSSYSLHLTRSSYDRCLLRALLYREASGYKIGAVKFLPGGNCRDFAQVFSNFGSTPPAKLRHLQGSTTVNRPLYLDNTLELHEEFWSKVEQPPPLNLGALGANNKSPRGGGANKKKNNGPRKKVKFCVAKFAYSETEQMLEVTHPQTKKLRKNHEVLKYFLEKNKIYAPLAKFISISQTLKKFQTSRPVERHMFLQSLAKEFIFSISQVRFVIQNFPTWERFTVVQELAGAVKLDDSMNSSMVSYTHAKLYNFVPGAESQRLKLKSKFMNYVRFNPSNPSGRYVLDLGKNGDVQTFQRLVIISAWEKKILQFYECPDFAQHGDLQLLRNVFVDGREHTVLAGGGILMNRRSKEKFSVGALLAEAASGGSGDEAGMQLKLDYYSPIHPHKKDRTDVHAAVMDNLCYMLETEKFLRKISKKSKMEAMAGSGAGNGIAQPGSKEEKIAKEKAKAKAERAKRMATSGAPSGSGGALNGAAGGSKSNGKNGESAGDQHATDAAGAGTTAGAARTRFGSRPPKAVSSKHAGELHRADQKDIHQKHAHGTGGHHGHHHKDGGSTRPTQPTFVNFNDDEEQEEEEPLREIPLSSRALALTAISDRLVLSYDDFVRVLLLFEDEEPDLAPARRHFGDDVINNGLDELVTRLTGGFSTAEDGIGKILEDRVAAHSLTKQQQRADAFVRLFTRCTELERVNSVECLYSTLLFDVFAMYQISYRLGRLICHDWINLDNRYAKSKIENPAETEKIQKKLESEVLDMNQTNYRLVCERLSYLKDKVEISNFQSTFHLFDLEVEEDWRLAWEMFRLGDAETTKYQTVILQDMKWSGGIDKEDAMYNPPRGWYNQGPPRKGYASLKYFIPWGVVKTVESYKKRRAIKNALDILLGDDSGEKKFALGSTPVEDSITWVCYWEPAPVSSSSSEGAPATRPTTGGSSATAAAPSDSEPAGVAATSEKTDSKQPEPGAEEEDRVHLLNAAGDGFFVYLNESTSYPLTLPCSLPIADAEKLLREFVFGGQEVRLLPVELEMKMESGSEEEKGEGSALADDKMDDTSDGGCGEGLKKGAEDDAMRGPLVSSLVAGVDRTTGTGGRRLEATLGFPHAESDSEVEDDERIQNSDDERETDTLNNGDSSEHEDDEEERASYTTENVVSRLKRVLGGEGRPGVGEWTVDLPASPVVHLPHSGEEYVLVGTEDEQKEKAVEKRAAAQDARLTPLLNAMKSVDRHALLNRRGDSVIRPGLFTINRKLREVAEQASHYHDSAGGEFLREDYENSKGRRRMAFPKSLNSREVSVTSGGVDILQHLHDANLCEKIQAELETGFPVELRFVRLDASGSCGYVDKMRTEKADELQKAKENRAERLARRAALLRETSSDSSSDDSQVESAANHDDDEHQQQVLGGSLRDPSNEEQADDVADAPPAADTTEDVAQESHQASGSAHDGAVTTGQPRSVSSSSSGVAGNGERFKSDDEDASYDNITAAGVAKFTPVARAYYSYSEYLQRRDRNQPKHPKHPGRFDVRVDEDDSIFFTPRSGGWRTLCNEDDADILRRRDDERSHTVGTLLVSVQGLYTQRGVVYTVARCGCTETDVILVDNDRDEEEHEETNDNENASSAGKHKLICSAIIRGLDVDEPAGIGINEYGGFERGHAFVLVYRILRRRRVPIIDRQQLLQNAMPQLKETLPQHPGSQPTRQQPGDNNEQRQERRREYTEWRLRQIAYEAAITRAVKRDELDRLAELGFSDNRERLREEKFRHRKKRWLLGHEPHEHHCYELTAEETNRLRDRFGNLLRRAWPSRKFFPSGGTLVLPCYGDEQYGAREVHPLRSHSLAKPLWRELPGPGHGRALTAAAKSGIAKATGPPKIVHDVNATAKSSGAVFYCYEDVDTYYERRVVVLGEDTKNTFMDVRGKDLIFCDRLPPFAWRCRHPEDSDVVGSGADAAALICGGPLAFASGGDAVPIEDHDDVDDPDDPFCSDPDYAALIRGVQRFSEHLVRTSGGTVGEDATKDQLEDGKVVWLENPNHGVQDRSAKALTGEYSSISGEKCEFETFFDPPKKSAKKSAVGTKEGKRGIMKVRLGGMNVVKLVVPPYEERGILPGPGRSFLVKKNTRTVMDELFEIHGGDCATREEFAALNKSELRTVGRFCNNVDERAMETNTRHRRPTEACCETLDALSNGGPDSRADRMCAYRDLLLKAGRAMTAASSAGSEYKSGPLEVVLASGGTVLISDEFAKVAPTQDLLLVQEAARGGAIVTLRWYLQELSQYPEKCASETTLGAETQTPGYVLGAAPVRNPFEFKKSEQESEGQQSTRGLAIEFGIEAFRPRRALALHKPLPSEHLRPVNWEGDQRQGQQAPTSTSMKLLDTSDQLADAQEQHPAADAVDCQLEFVADNKAKGVLRSREKLRRFLFEEVGPQYDCINTQDVWRIFLEQCGGNQKRAIE
eukprot:g2377.t1